MEKSLNKNHFVNELHPIIEKILRSRGYEKNQFDDFLSKDLNKLPSLKEMKDLNKASLRIIKAIEGQEKIAVYGDYDVDGCTSCALLVHFFRMLNIEIKTFQPSRFVEGYGIHPPAIDKAIDEEVSVLITVDCGITNNEAAEYAQQRGLDLIITDHHKDANETMPAAFAVINPNRRDEPGDSPLKCLAGVGVAFALALEIKIELEKKGQKIPTLYPLLQFVAIGTICDMAYLNPMNLKLVRHGLLQLPKSNYPGILQFLSPEERTFTSTPSEKLGFSIGPMINSKGRLEHPEAALKLLISKDSSEAYPYFAQLEISNRERKFVQKEVFEEAKKQVIDSITNEDPLINIVFGSDWHEGVIGIVASKLVESFKVPAIVFSEIEPVDGVAMIKASARSAGTLNLFDCLNQCQDLFTKFGGHKAAAGLSMKKENLPILKKRLQQILTVVPEIERTRQDDFDLVIRAGEITPQLVKQLEVLEPFGQGNTKPRFLLKGARLKTYSLMKDVHVRWEFVDPKTASPSLRGVSFNYIGKWGCLSPQDIFQKQEDEDLKVLCTLGINRFKGNEYIQIMVEKIFF